MVLTLLNGQSRVWIALIVQPKQNDATQRIPGVSGVAVSVTMGTISIDIDLGEGHTSKVSAVMTSLGHEPDVT